jgi:hypothetical protein
LHAVWININHALTDLSDDQVTAPHGHSVLPLRPQRQSDNQMSDLRTEIVRTKSLIARVLTRHRCQAMPNHAHRALIEGGLDHLYLVSGDILDALVVCVAITGTASRPLTSYFQDHRGDSSALEILDLVRVAQSLSTGDPAAGNGRAGEAGAT